MTRDHPMVVIRRKSAIEMDASERAEWIPAGDVHAGDYVAYPRPALVVAGARPSKSEYTFRSIIANDETPYDAMVHNLEVAEANSYLTVGATLHNCGDFGILTGVQIALASRILDPDMVACSSGIGGAGRTSPCEKSCWSDR